MQVFINNWSLTYCTIDSVCAGSPQGVGPVKAGQKTTAGIAGLLVVRFDNKKRRRPGSAWAHDIYSNKMYTKFSGRGISILCQTKRHSVLRWPCECKQSSTHSWDESFTGVKDFPRVLFIKHYLKKKNWITFQIKLLHWIGLISSARPPIHHYSRGENLLLS